MPLLSFLIAGELIIGLLFALPAQKSSGSPARANQTISPALAQAADAPAVSADPADTSLDTSGATSQEPNQQNPADNAGGEPAQPENQPSGETQPAEPQPAETQPETPTGAGETTPAPSAEPTPENQPAGENPLPENPPTEETIPAAGENPLPESQPPENAPQENQNPEVIERLSPAEETQTISTGETLPAQETAQIQEAVSFTNPETIDPQIIEKSRTEDAAIAAAQSPQEETALLIQFADEKVTDIAASLEIGDYGSSDFLVTRLNSQIDDALAAVGSLPPDQAASLKQDVLAFAQKAEPEFRAAQLTVPEGMEQDFEIARAKLLNIEEFK